MKLTVIFDDDGNVLGTATTQRPEGESPPDEVGVLQESGQFIRELDVPDQLAKASAHELHERLKQVVAEIPTKELPRRPKLTS